MSVITQTVTKKIITVNFFPDEDTYSQSSKDTDALNLIPAGSGGSGALASTKTFSITSAISSGGTLTLPLEYTVTSGTKDYLGLVYEGVSLVRGVDYTEVGQPNATSTTVTLLFDAEANDTFVETTLIEY